MYKQITEKNLSYVVKSIINTSEALQNDTDENSNPTNNPKATKTTTTLLNPENKSSQTNAVNEYKNAILNMGSKTLSKPSRRAGNKTTAIITEDEYEVTDDWLEIVDNKRSKNKRKLQHDTFDSDQRSVESEIDEKSDSDSVDEKKSQMYKKRLISFNSPNSKSSEFSSLMKAMLNTTDSNDSTSKDNLPKDKMNS
jgi:hypothetical protein